MEINTQTVTMNLEKYLPSWWSQLFRKQLSILYYRMKNDDVFGRCPFTLKSLTF